MPLAPAARKAVSANIQAAVEVARRSPAGVRDQILTTAKDGFMSGMHLAAIVAAGIVIVAAIGVFLWLPSRAPTEAEARDLAGELDPEKVPEPVGSAPGTS